MKKILFCILGRSASGKDTLSAEICKEMGLEKLMSYTTRPARSQQDCTHIFTTIEKMIEHSEKGQIAAWSKIGENYYWSTIGQLYTCDIYVTDYVGLKQIKELDRDDIKIVTIYIAADENSRRQRAYLRHPSGKDAYEQRIAAENAQFSELEEKEDWDYCIYNDRFEDAYNRLKQIVITERNKYAL